MHGWDTLLNTFVYIPFATRFLFASIIYYPMPSVWIPVSWSFWCVAASFTHEHPDGRRLCLEVRGMLPLTLLNIILMLLNYCMKRRCLIVAVLLLLTLLTSTLMVITYHRRISYTVFSLCCVAAYSSHKHPNANNSPQVKTSCPYDRKKFTEIEVLEHKGGPIVDVISVQTRDLNQEILHLMQMSAELAQFRHGLEDIEFNRNWQELERNGIEISLENEETRQLKRMGDDLKKKMQLLRYVEECDRLSDRMVQLAVQLENA